MELQERLILVPAVALDEVMELARLCSERLPQNDPIVLALRGAIGKVRAEIIVEP